MVSALLPAQAGADEDPLVSNQQGGDGSLSLPSPPSVRPVESLDGPLPDKREIVERQFTTYCALHLGHPRRAAPKKVELLRHFFNLVRMADGTAAIQPYMRSDTVNSICHSHHISEHIKDFEYYFPEVKYRIFHCPT